VEKSQYDLCVEVLSRLDKAGILNDIVPVGSWALTNALTKTIPTLADFIGC
jgi:hypothetical protein